MLEEYGNSASHLYSVVLRALGHTLMPHKATAEAALAGEWREALDCRDGAPF